MEQKPTLIKLAQRCMIENTIANTTWYLHRHLLCDKLCTSSFMTKPPVFSFVVARPFLVYHRRFSLPYTKVFFYLPPVQLGVYFRLFGYHNKSRGFPLSESLCFCILCSLHGLSHIVCEQFASHFNSSSRGTPRHSLGCACRLRRALSAAAPKRNSALPAQCRDNAVRAFWP